MIDLYYWTTPNGHKITMFLEEAGLDYKIIPINIGKGDQLKPEFLQISPNNKIPAIVDHDPKGNEDPLKLFESGAILEYLADKTGRFLPVSGEARYRVLEWLYWQVAGLGPMAGQNHHFTAYAPERIPYAIERYQKETKRLYRVLNERLTGRSFVAGADYSIADMAIYPWTVSYDKQGIDLAHFPAVRDWYERVSSRPATKRAYARADEFKADSAMTEESKKILFGQE